MIRPLVPYHTNSFHNISSPADLLSEHTCFCWFNQPITPITMLMTFSCDIIGGGAYRKIACIPTPGVTTVAAPDELN
jgi:hypothetical protein